MVRFLKLALAAVPLALIGLAAKSFYAPARRYAKIKRM